MAIQEFTRPSSTAKPTGTAPVRSSSGIKEFVPTGKVPTAPEPQKPELPDISFGKKVKQVAKTAGFEFYRQSNALADTIMGLASGVIKGNEKSRAKMSEIFGGADNPNNPYAGPAPIEQLTGTKLADIATNIDKYRKGQRDFVAGQGEQFAEKNPYSQSFAGKTSGVIGGILPQITLAAAKVPSIALSASEAAQNVQQSYDENINSGMSPQDARRIAIPQFVGDFAMTAISNKFGVLGKYSGETKRVITTARKNFLAKALAFAGEKAKDTAAEIAQEGWQNILQNIATGKPATDGLAETAKLTIIPTLLFSTVADVRTSQGQKEVKAAIEQAQAKEQAGGTLTEKEKEVMAVAQVYDELAKDSVIDETVGGNRVQVNVSKVGDSYRAEVVVTDPNGEIVAQVPFNTFTDTKEAAVQEVVDQAPPEYQAVVAPAVEAVSKQENASTIIQQVASDIVNKPKLEEEKKKPFTEEDRYAEFPEKKTLSDQYDPDDYKGINPENIMHFNQGANARVTFVMPARDKHIVEAASKMRSQKASRAQKDYAASLLKQNNVTVQEAFKMHDEYKALAKANADKNLPVIVNTVKKPKSKKEAKPKKKTTENDILKNIADTAYNDIKENGGVTISMEGNKPSKGYAYAPEKDTETIIPLDEFTPQDFYTFTEKHADILSKPGYYAGSWVSDGKVYMDISKVGEPTVETLEEAQNASQLAVFDLENFEEITTGQITDGAYTKVDEAANIYDQYQRKISEANSLGDGAIVPEIQADGITAGGTGEVVLSAPQATGSKREANAVVQSVSNGYNQSVGTPSVDYNARIKVDKEFSREIAAEYEKLKTDNSSDPVVAAAYGALRSELQAQWDYVTQTAGVKFEPWTSEGQPYADSAEMMADIRDNNHLYYFTGGEPHPFLDQKSPSGPTYNEMLRAIHDYFGHAAGGNTFSNTGEENAWLAHSQMFSPIAQRALTTKTRAQNNWVNNGPQNYNEDGTYKNIPPSERPYAEQKVDLLPVKYSDYTQFLPKKDQKDPKVLASTVYERLKAENPNLTEDVLYEQMKMKEDAEKAVKLIATDKQKAYRVALGLETVEGQTSTAINIAMAEQALREGNYELYAQLVKSRSLAQTKRGQEIVAEKGSVTDNSTARYVKELLNSRIDSIGVNFLSDLKAKIQKKTTKKVAQEVVEKKTKEAKTKIDRKALDLSSAQAILDSLSC